MTPLFTTKHEATHQVSPQMSPRMSPQLVSEQRVAVTCSEINKTFISGDVEARILKDVNLSIPAGRLTLLIGPSGCGKTTLISILAGILTPSSGSVDVFGRDLSKMTPNELSNWRKRAVGFVFQSFNLVPSLSIMENVSIPLLINGVKRADALEKAHEMLQRVGLENRVSHFPSQLSGGQQQRVAIARSIVHKPAFVVCDEPTSALDHESGQVVMDLIKSMVTPETSIIVVTHDSRIFNYADTIIELDDGQVKNVRHVR